MKMPNVFSTVVSSRSPVAFKLELNLFAARHHLRKDLQHLHSNDDHQRDRADELLGAALSVLRHPPRRVPRSLWHQRTPHEPLPAVLQLV